MKNKKPSSAARFTNTPTLLLSTTLLFILMGLTGCATTSRILGLSSSDENTPQEKTATALLPAELANDLVGVNDTEKKTVRMRDENQNLTLHQSDQYQANQNAVTPDQSITPKRKYKPTRKPKAGNLGVVQYRVKNTDTLMKISYEQLGDPLRWKEIYEQNSSKIKDKNSLARGILLTIQRDHVSIANHEGLPYRIKQKDTLIKISDSVYGTPKKWQRIWKNNLDLIQNPNKIYSGFRLYYLMNENDRAEFERLRGSPSLAQPAPMASVSEPAPSNRAPASRQGIPVPLSR